MGKLPEWLPCDTRIEFKGTVALHHTIPLFSFNLSLWCSPPSNPYPNPNLPLWSHLHTIPFDLTHKSCYDRHVRPAFSYIYISVILFSKRFATFLGISGITCIQLFNLAQNSLIDWHKNDRKFGLEILTDSLRSWENSSPGGRPQTEKTLGKTSKREASTN